MTNQRDELLLAEEFFRHDLGNKQNLRDGFTEAINMRQDGEYAPNDEQTHKYARKAWQAQKEIVQLEKEAEKILKSDEQLDIDVEECIEFELDQLQSSIQHYGKKVETNYNAEDTTVQTHRTFEDMVYNLFDNSIEHGCGDIEITLDEYSEGLKLDVEDGSQTDFDSILPGTLERKDYNGTGTYLIDQVLQRTEMELEDTEGGYRLKMPRT